jgi:hypothetical protein
MKSELSEAQQAWMTELNRIGIAEGMDGFPMQPRVLHGANCWLEDFDAGLTPREAIERNKPYQPPPPERNANGKFEYQVYAFPDDDTPDNESPVFECDNDDEARRVAANYAAQWRVPTIELCRVRYRSGRTQIIEQMGFIDTAQEPPGKS